jgi:hypothetical protein
MGALKEMAAEWKEGRDWDDEELSEHVLDYLEQCAERREVPSEQSFSIFLGNVE